MYNKKLAIYPFLPVCSFGTEHKKLKTFICKLDMHWGGNW